MSKKIPSLANLPTLGPGDKIGQGDSFIKYNLIESERKSALHQGKTLSEDIFQLLHDEVAWQKMFHASGEVPRLVAVQGKVGRDGSKPIYRHPSDKSLPLLQFTPTVTLIKAAAEEVVGHKLNHVLVQLYRDGNDYISEHSDKTLDITKNSKIVNASFGARRTMRLRRKRRVAIEDVTDAITPLQPGGPRETQRIPMPHNSLFVLGLDTNRSWLHGINADKRLVAERSPEELAYGGMRISLTFRLIDTFLDEEEKHIWGQGAKGKTKDDASEVVAGQDDQTVQMIIAFGKENHQDEEWDWEGSYGEGFNVLHFQA
jgi:alkylated DNA repair dioxygenase AlkB